MTNPSMDADILRLATNLRMGSAIAELYSKIPFTDPASYVHGLLQALWDARIKERVLRWQQQAGFEQKKTLENYTTDHLELPKGMALSWFTECHFVEQKQNLILLGNPGTGKTHFATALGMEACSRGYKTCFWRMARLVNELTASQDDKSAYNALRRRLNDASLLIIDEWGYLPTNVNGTRLLFELISDSYEKRSVVITTNLPMAEWKRIFCDERLLFAIMDRLIHHGYLIKHTGDSYRLSHSLMR